MALRLLALLFLLLSAPSVVAVEIPANDGFITDEVNILSQEQELGLEGLLKAFQTRTGNEIAVVIVKTTAGEAMADAAVQIGRAWGVGTKEDDNGILMLVSYEDREIFIATGYGLEGAVPDLAGEGIIEQVVLPHFRDGEYFEGISGAIDALTKLTDGEYSPEKFIQKEGEDYFNGILFVLFIFLEFGGAFLARSKSWWLGGVLGAILGIVYSLMFGSWLTVPLLTLIGLLFDYYVSKRGGRGSFLYFGGGRGGRGGFGGFGGGSFGGGGAGGRW